MSFNGASLYTQGFGSRAENVEIPLITNRIPTTADINYPIGKVWIDQLSNGVYQLTSFTSGGGTTTATWTYLAQASGALNNLVTSDSSVVIPASGSINLFQGTGLTTTGSGSTVNVALDVPVSLANGGTNNTSFTAYGVITTDSTGLILESLTPGNTGQVIIGSTGGAAAFADSVTLNGSLTAGTGLIATTGGLTVTAGGAVITDGGLSVVDDGASIVGTTLINATGDADTTIGNATGAGIFTMNTPAGGFTLTGNGNAVNIATDSYANVVTLGVALSGASTTIYGGSDGLTIDGTSDCPINLAPSLTTGTITMGGSSQTGDIILGEGASTNAIYVGHGSGTTTLHLNDQTTNGAILCGESMTTGTIGIGGSGQTGTITIAGGLAAQEVDIANVTGGKTVIIANGAANADVNSVIIGSTNAASALTLNAGSAGITYNGEVQGNGGLNLSVGSVLGYEVAGMGGDACGTIALSSGTVTVNTSACTTDSLVLVVVNNIGTVVAPQVMTVPTATIANGSFIINSADPTDTSTVTWFLFNT